MCSEVLYSLRALTGMYVLVESPCRELSFDIGVHVEGATPPKIEWSNIT